MKVKLSKNMKLIAIIVLSLIIITYMFYNSVKEGLGKKKGKKGGKKKGSGDYERPQYKSMEDCKKDEEKRVPPCKIQGKKEGEFIDCDRENDDHKSRIKDYDKMKDSWLNNWCFHHEIFKDPKNMIDPKTRNWMKENHSTWKQEQNWLKKEWVPLLEAGNKNAGSSPLLGSLFAASMADDPDEAMRKGTLEFDIQFR